MAKRQRKPIVRPAALPERCEHALLGVPERCSMCWQIAGASLPVHRPAATVAVGHDRITIRQYADRLDERDERDHERAAQYRERVRAERDATAEPTEGTNA